MNQLQLPIRNAGLYSALRQFVLDAFALLAEQRADGADVSFSVEEHRRTRDDRPFYEYRPMTERYVRERIAAIMDRRPAQDAAWAVASDPACNQWLRAGRADAVADLEMVARDEVMVPLLLAMAEASPSFELEDDALLSHYLRFEDLLYTRERRYAAAVPLWGVRLVYGDLALADGVTIRQVDPELFRMEWPEAAQMNWGERSREGLPGVLLQFERAVTAEDDEHATDPLSAVVQVVAALRALAGGSVCAGPVVLERLDYATLAPRPVPAMAARPCGSMPTRVDGTVAKHLPVALRRLSADPDGPVGRALERYQMAATSVGLGALRAVYDTLVEIYADERETMSAALRLAVVAGSSLAERQQFVRAMQDAAAAIRAARPADEHVANVTRVLAAALRATIAAALVGELPINRLQSYADSVLLGERERKRLGVASLGSTL